MIIRKNKKISELSTYDNNQIVSKIEDAFSASTMIFESNGNISIKIHTKKY
ncbi:hypothetical protein [Clostridium sp. M14]|uniref:hypothetical protein n=1 Tax=Clostridium sp. M14 TaxID=2716311 RepID=UPI0013EE9977|nr:hypothetical protein [Clostridium sp. M14]MBZ9693232.1 hypothetical protein [Clostridium sp. M14]